MTHEPTLEDILSDEATRQLMRSDQVRADEVRELMRTLSQRRHKAALAC